MGTVAMRTGAATVMMPDTTASVCTLTREMRYAVAMLVSTPATTCGRNCNELVMADVPCTSWKLASRQRRSMG